MSDYISSFTGEEIDDILDKASTIADTDSEEDDGKYLKYSTESGFIWSNNSSANGGLPSFEDVPPDSFSLLSNFGTIDSYFLVALDNGFPFWTQPQIVNRNDASNYMYALTLVDGSDYTKVEWRNIADYRNIDSDNPIIPSYSVEDAGKVLTVTDSGVLEWMYLSDIQNS